MLDCGANIELTESNSKSVLHLAVDEGDIKMLELLIRKGGKKLVNQTDKEYKTPLHYAASSRNEEVSFSYLYHFFAFTLLYTSIFYLG